MLNRITIAGRLTKDPELRRTASGKPVTTIRIACDRPKEGVDFVDVVAWNGCAENICRYMKKGRMVIADGRLMLREWEQNGQKRTAAEVVADSVFFMDRPSEPSEPPREQERPQLDEVDDEDGELPF